MTRTQHSRTRTQHSRARAHARTRINTAHRHTQIQQARAHRHGHAMHEAKRGTHAETAARAPRRPSSAAVGQAANRSHSSVSGAGWRASLPKITKIATRAAPACRNDVDIDMATSARCVGVLRATGRAAAWLLFTGTGVDRFQLQHQSTRRRRRNSVSRIRVRIRHVTSRLQSPSATAARIKCERAQI